MARTTVMLPAALKSRAAQWGRKRGMSLGEVIREALVARIRRRDGDSAGDSLLDDNTVFDDDGPTDVAARHDDYLYSALPTASRSR